jgi:hypothetical protein
MSFSNVDFSSDYPVPDPATSFFISPTGDDTLGNGTISNPYKTFTRAYRGLTAWRVANGGSTAHGYLIALNGVYDYTNQNLSGKPQNSVASGGYIGLMTPGVLQNVTLMSNEPLGAKVNYFVKTTEIGVFNQGQENEYRKYLVDTTSPGITFTLRLARSALGIGSGTIDVPHHIFFGRYNIILGPLGNATPPSDIRYSLNTSTPEKSVVYLSDPAELPRLSSSGTIGYPAIYGYAPPTDPAELAAWEEENWTANLREWSSFRDDNNQFGLGLTYDFQFIPERGITGAWIRQRDDLLPGPQGNTYWLDNTRNPPVFLKDILLEMESNNPGISWTNNVVAFRGGNSNVSLARIVQMEAANGRFLVDNPATWFGEELVWNGTRAVRSGAQPTMALAFVNKIFIKRPGQYAFDGDTLYLQNHPGNTRSPVVRSDKMNLIPFLLTTSKNMQAGVPDGSNDVNFTKNIVIAGFSISGCNEAVSTKSIGVNDNLRSPTNVKMTCNIVHDNLLFAGFQVAEGYGKIEVSNNFVLRTDDRALYVGRAINKHNFWQLDEPTLFYNNTCYNWRRGAGIMVQGAEGVRVIGNKMYTVGPVAHGDGMAVYSFSHDVEVKDNYIYTPNVIGLAINDIYRSPGGVAHRFTNNIVLGGVILRDSDNLNGVVFENNTFGINNTENQPNISRTTTSTDFDPWWGALKNYRFRNNVVLSTANWMSIETAEASSGNSYTVFTGNNTWPFQSEFTDIATKMRGPSGEWYTYSPHYYTASDGFPNWYNNIAPNLYQFDQVLGVGNSVLGIRYPYTETSTYLINNQDMFRPRSFSAYGTWAINNGFGDIGNTAAQALYTQLREESIYSRIFQDYPNGNLNIKSGVTAYDGSVVPSTIGTNLPYTIPPITNDTTDDDFESRLDEFWTVKSSTENNVISNPPPIPNYPITINLSTTDLTEDVNWLTKNGTDGHSGDGIFPSTKILRIPNIMHNIAVFANPANDPEIGPSTQDEIDGASGGGIFIISQEDANRNYTLSAPLPGSKNDLNITGQVKDFMGLGKINGGQTMCLIMHGKVDPSPINGEFKTIIGNDVAGQLDEFYKSNSYIAFNSIESEPSSGQTRTLTTNLISFRKNPHHLYLNLSPTNSDLHGIRDYGATAELFITAQPSNNLQLFRQKIASLQIPPGTTLTVNSYDGEITNANHISPNTSTPTTISCGSKTYSFNQVAVDGSTPNGRFVLTTTTSPHALFTGILKNQTYYHSDSVNGQTVSALIISFLNAQYSIDANQRMAFRLQVPSNLGTKNLLAYEIKNPTNTRLFGGTTNLGIEVGSYIRISGSSSNNGIYKVLSLQDGIDGDSPSNNKYGTGLSEFQYLELSREITPEVPNSISGNNITIENVSHLPILHIKYRTTQ